MSDEEKKQYKTEWSFSFDRIGARFNEVLSSIGGDEEVQSAQFTDPVTGVTSANITISPAIGRINLHALDDSDHLIDADLKYVGEVEFKTSGDSVRDIELKQKTSMRNVVGSVRQTIKSIASREDLVWNIGLNRNVPLRLELDGGVSQSVLDLSGLNLVSLELDGGVGQTTITLPDAIEPYEVEIDGGVGQTTINVPASAAAKIKIDGGVGLVRIHVPAGAAVRFTTDGTLGSVNLPDHFTRTKSGDEIIGRSGTWETPGFSVADKQVEIFYDGGVGSLQVVSEA